MESSEAVGTTTSSPRDAARAELVGKYLTFHLAQELYGVEILKVQEIIGVLPVTKVPKSPSCIKGVINLRGKVIPVIDLRLKLDLGSRDYDERTCIIVVNIEMELQNIAVGVVVDSVREVYSFDIEQIELAPRFGMDADSNAILGMGKIDEAVVILLDINKALDISDKEFLDKAVKPQQH